MTSTTSTTSTIPTSNQKLMWDGSIYKVIPSNISTSDELMAGSYEAGRNDRGELLIKPLNIVSDRLLNIPSAEYKTVASDITKFLTDNVRAKYRELGFVYKRSFFLYGSPGTGKSCLVNRVAAEVIARNGIVLLNTSNPIVIQQFLQSVRMLSPDRTIMVILEEFDAAIKVYSESEYLTMLDGQIQIDNVIYMATTNYVEKVPVRLLRPGRFNRSLETGYPDEACRRYYIGTVFPTLTPKELNTIVKATAKCSIDECREVVQAHCILGDDLRSTVRSILKIRGIEQDISDMDYQDRVDEFDNHFEPRDTLPSTSNRLLDDGTTKLRAEIERNNKAHADTFQGASIPIPFYTKK